VGLTDVKPDFRILANKRDITAEVRQRLVSISLSDATGIESDTLELVISDTDPARPVRKPSRGAELELSLGYNGSLVRMGAFVVDEIEISGWPRTISIRARGTPFDESTSGAAHLQTQKTRTWKRETTIGDMVAKIAKEHGLKANVSQSLKQTKMPQFNQTAESDISFLVRVGKRYDAMVKPGGGKLSFIRRGEQSKADGSPMPTIAIKANEVTSFHFTEASRDDGGTIVAFWHATKQARRRQIEVGSGEPVTQLRHFYATEDAAKAAAKSELDKRKRGQATLSVSLPGNPALSAECALAPSGFHPDMPTTWLVTRVSHRLSADGYRCDVEAELPNA
jgi:uncharacterized protein